MRRSYEQLDSSGAFRLTLRLPGIVLRPPATPAQVVRAQRQLDLTVPDVVRELWSHSDGFALPGGFVLYSTDEIGERNRTWEAPRYAPGYVVIGDDSGGRLVVMKAAPGSTEVFSSDAGDLEPARFTRLGTDLGAWIESGASTEDAGSRGQVALASVDVYLDRSPDDVKDLLVLKSTLGVELGLGAIKRGLETPPVLLARGVPYQKFQMRVERLPKALQVLVSFRPVAL